MPVDQPTRDEGLTSAYAANAGAALGDRYRIERELGAGGMATVFLAQDVRHGRRVALKLLSPELSAVIGPPRFLKEIEVTARLQHPHILPLFDSGEVDGRLFYVMPFVEGETLRARLRREHQLPLDDAVRLACDVADALGHAHGQGIVHRDIKPENILLQGGHAVVADFGIALAIEQSGGERLTQTGLSIGTPQYMAPEQASGERSIDHRADIYALGCVLYEMLVGEPPFTGPTAQSVVAKALTEDATPVARARATVPPHLDAAVMRALAKIPADRFSSVTEFAAAISVAGAPTTAPPWRALGRMSLLQRLLIPGLSVAVVVSASLAMWEWRDRPVAAGPVTRVTMALPAGQEIRPGVDGFSFDLSPDGSRLAYVGAGGTAGGRETQIWIRPLDELQASAVPGTTGASGVRWSPDGSRLVILLNRGARILSVAGGQYVDVDGIYKDATPGSGDEVYSALFNVIVRRSPAATDTLYVTDSTWFISDATPLPGHAGILFARAPAGGLGVATELMALRTGQRTPVSIGKGVYARVLPSGVMLLVASDGTAFTARFDVKNLKIVGTPVAIARVAFGIANYFKFPQIALADDGTCVYLAGDVTRQQLTWLGANGRLQQRMKAEGNFWGISLSPDATHVAYSALVDPRDPSATADVQAQVWVEDVRTGGRTLVARDGANLRPSWSPDGQSVLYNALAFGMRERRADASRPERMVLTHEQLGHSVADAQWLPGRGGLVVRTFAEPSTRSMDLYYTTLQPGAKAVPVATTTADERAPVPSPDGLLLAFLSTESGKSELYVQRFPAGGEQLRVSNGGASPPRWSHDGRQLYYWTDDGQLKVATIAPRPALAVAATRTIETDVVPGGLGPGMSNSVFDVAPDGRILVAEPVARPFDLVLVRNALRASGAGHVKP